MNEAGGGASRLILGMAHRYAQKGLIHHATELYLRLVRKYPRAQEGQEARRRLLEIAKQHEVSGRGRLALSLYDQLAALPTTGESAGQGRGPTMEEDTRGRIVEEAPRRYDEIPFVDLTEEVDIKQNFKRLGCVQRRRMDILRTVNSLKKLKGSSLIL